MKNEIKLAESLKKGDAKALEKIIAAFSAYVCTVIRNFSKGMLSEEDIDESAADVFIRLWQHRERLDPECGIKPYISAVARNVVKNRFRALPAATEDIDGDSLSAVAADDFDLAERVEISQIMQCLNSGLSQIPKEDREIFLRFYFYGEKTSDISAHMRLKDGTVRSKLTRTRQRLKDYLKERGFDNV